VALSPRCGAQYLNLAHCDRITADDPYISAIEDLARDQDTLSEQDRIDLDFALGKACADIGRHKQSFRHLLRGNARKRNGYWYCLYGKDTDPSQPCTSAEAGARVWRGNEIKSGCSENT
jgi:hypothetical protein